MHPSRISVPDEEKGKSPTYPFCILGLGRVQEFLCVPKKLLTPEHGFIHHLFYPLAAVHTGSAALLPLLCLQYLHCLVIYCITHMIAFLDLSGKGEVSCLLELSTPPRCSAYKDFFLPASRSFILPTSAARMPTPAWQGLWIWAQCLADTAKSLLVPGWLLRAPRSVYSLVEFCCRLAKLQWILEHQLYIERVFLTICLPQVSLSY